MHILDHELSVIYRVDEPIPFLQVIIGHPDHVLLQMLSCTYPWRLLVLLSSLYPKEPTLRGKDTG